MNNALNPALPFLDASALIERASNLDSIHTRTLMAIDRLQRDVDAQKRAAADRWKSTASLGLNPSDRVRIEAEEVRVGVLTIRQNAQKELDALMKEAGAAHADAVAQRDFYDSPVKTLNRLTLGSPRRTEYMRQVESVGTAELAHLAQFAVSTKNRDLAAAIVTRLDGMRSGERPFNAATLATAMQLDEHRKAAEAIKIADARLQSIVVAIRAWKAGTSNPLNTVQLALRNRELDPEVLKQLEADDAAR
jgi:hypothetical protein